jgi:hypothetical protein
VNFAASTIGICLAKDAISERVRLQQSYGIRDSNQRWLIALIPKPLGGKTWCRHRADCRAPGAEQRRALRPGGQRHILIGEHFEKRFVILDFSHPPHMMQFQLRGFGFRDCSAFANASTLLKTRELTLQVADFALKSNQLRILLGCRRLAKSSEFDLSRPNLNTALRNFLDLESYCG